MKLTKYSGLGGNGYISTEANSAPEESVHVAPWQEITINLPHEVRSVRLILQVDTYLAIVLKNVSKDLAAYLVSNNRPFSAERVLIVCIW